MKMQFLVAALLLLSFGTSLKAQDQAIIDAFAKSYEYEAQKGKLGDAIRVLTAVYVPNNYDINLRLGWLHYIDKKYTESVGYYKKCVDMMPLAIEARLGYVLPLAAQENWTEVLAQYMEIVKYDPANTLVNYRIGLIYYFREDYTTAERYFEKVVNLYPFDYNSVLMLAWTKYFLTKSSEAKTLFKKVLLISPADESALDGLSRIK